MMNGKMNERKYRLCKPMLRKSYRLQVKRFFMWWTIRKFATLENAKQFIHRLGYEIV